jgi:cytochrome c553
MMKRIIAVAVLLTLSAVSLGEVPKKAVSCVACHGQGGVSVNPEWPSLAGQKQTYLVNQLTAFRDGVRKNALMAPMIRGLTDQDIRELANYFASQPISIAANGKASLVAAGQNRAAYCVACHGMKGVTANEEWPNIAGQHAKYLEDQLRAFHSGDRENGLMQNIVKTFDPADFAALAAFFSQLEP